jgi:hypothetical protein
MYQQDYQPQPQLNPQDLLYPYEQPQFNNAPVFAKTPASVPATPVNPAPVSSVPANQSEAAPVIGANFFTQMPRTEAEAYAFCRRVATSMFCPKAFKPENFLKKVQAYEKDEAKARALALEESIGNIFVCFMYGCSLELQPLQALQGIAVVNGIPSLYGDLLYAICKSRAKVQVTENWDDNNKVAYCRVERPGYQPVEQSFGFNDAIFAGLMVQDPKTGYLRGNKEGPWSAYPKRMCQMRARSLALRDQCPDLLRGLAIYEEAADIPAEQTESSEQAEVPEKRRRRTKAEMLASQIQIQKEIQQRNAEMQQEQIPPINEPPADAHAQDMLNKYGDM